MNLNVQSDSLNLVASIKCTDKVDLILYIHVRLEVIRPELELEFHCFIKLQQRSKTIEPRADHDFEFFHILWRCVNPLNYALIISFDPL